MIEIHDLRSGYAGTDILHGMDLTLPGGRITVIAGPNGCGKSTLLKTIAGVLPAQGGRILLDGQPLEHPDPRQMARKVAYLSQSRQLPEIMAGRLVLHGRFPYLSYPRRYRQKDLEIARQAMETMGIADLWERDMVTLSGGQRQKVYIALALAQDTPLVLLDEPNTFLDIGHQMQLMGHARTLAEMGKTVVLVLHDLAMALKYADHLVVMENGRIMDAGSPVQVFERGCLERVFGVRVERVHTGDGWQYYYTERG